MSAPICDGQTVTRGYFTRHQFHRKKVILVFEDRKRNFFSYEMLKVNISHFVDMRTTNLD